MKKPKRNPKKIGDLVVDWSTVKRNEMFGVPEQRAKELMAMMDDKPLSMTPYGRLIAVRKTTFNNVNEIAFVLFSIYESDVDAYRDALNRFTMEDVRAHELMEQAKQYAIRMCATSHPIEKVIEMMNEVFQKKSV